MKDEGGGEGTILDCFFLLFYVLSFICNFFFFLQLLRGDLFVHTLVCCFLEHLEGMRERLTFGKYHQCTTI